MAFAFEKLSSSIDTIAFIPAWRHFHRSDSRKNHDENMDRCLRRIAACFFFTLEIAFALIEGIEGNEKLNDARLPKGAGAIINRRDRIAWWEGEEEVSVPMGAATPK